MRIVIAMDSFKGSMSARTACSRVGDAILREHPDWSVVLCPMADGGEGTAAAMAEAADGELITVQNVCGPLPGMTLDAAYAWLPDRRIAVVEMARTGGLPLLTPRQRNPLLTTTFGVGQLLRAALTRDPERILLGLGGSATVDGGTGAASAFDWRFVDAAGKRLPPGGGSLIHLDRIVPPECPEPLPPIEILCDVDNPLTGPRGAAEVFAPQKGATPEMVTILETGLKRLGSIVRRDLGIDVDSLPGAGAAGGFGAGGVAFFRARLVSGIQAVAQACGLRGLLDGADWVITGEGCFDEQSLHGKVVSGVRDVAAKAGVKVAVLAGRVRLPGTASRAAGFDAAVALAPPAVAEETALEQAARRIQPTVRRLIRDHFTP